MSKNDKQSQQPDEQLMMDAEVRVVRLIYDDAIKVVKQGDILDKCVKAKDEVGANREFNNLKEPIEDLMASVGTYLVMFRPDFVDEMAKKKDGIHQAIETVTKMFRSLAED